ncbi:aminoacyl-tRNA hydrolase [Micrococcus sp. M4NT]|uniref:aminoacyl-tRNA hydrolase n=1 Tax=Micrococcus sp. M4NT TaxID=2957501 RepID=UPI0029B7CB6C|nr:aminoacyl-tRNA hydrolase [Micrococcus sp. M4NT]MDX2341068.1 aminoacyl-tRNA hydrolase [Micrococcus sp. M4NT]
MTGTHLIMGLGNPGPEYERTRHNIGHMVAGELASRMGSGFTRHKAGAAVATGRLGIGGPRVVLAMSTGYMNTSGGPTSALLKFYGLEPADLVVVHDELDIPFDTLRLKRGGGEGGHNGLKSITRSIGTPDYFRVRAGIGRPPGRMDVADFVLRPFTSEEQKALPFHVDRAADAVEKLLADGLEAAQQSFH